MVYGMVTSNSENKTEIRYDNNLQSIESWEQDCGMNTSLQLPQNQINSQQNYHSLNQTEDILEAAVLSLSSLNNLFLGVQSIIKDEYYRSSPLSAEIAHYFEQFVLEVDFLVLEAELYEKNLLLGENLDVLLNSTENKIYTIKGKNISSNSLNIQLNNILNSTDDCFDTYYNTLTEAQHTLSSFKTSLLISHQIITNRCNFINQRHKLNHRISVQKLESPPLNAPNSLTKLISNVSAKEYENNLDDHEDSHILKPSETDSEDIVFEIIETLENNEQQRELEDLFTKYDNQAACEVLGTEKQQDEPQTSQSSEGFLSSFFYAEKEEKNNSGIRTILDRLQETENLIETVNLNDFDQKMGTLNELSSKILKHIDKKHFKILESSMKDMNDIIYSEALSTSIVQKKQEAEFLYETKPEFEALFLDYEDNFKALVKEQKKEAINQKTIEQFVKDWLNSTHGIIYKIIFQISQKK